MPVMTRSATRALREQELCNEQLWAQMAAVEPTTPPDDEDNSSSSSSEPAGLAEGETTPTPPDDEDNGPSSSPEPAGLAEGEATPSTKPPFLLAFLLLVLSFAAAALSLIFPARRVPATNPSPLDPAPLLDLQRRLDRLANGVAQVDDFGDRLAGLEPRVDHIDQLHRLLTDLDHKVENYLASLIDS